MRIISILVLAFTSLGAVRTHAQDKAKGEVGYAADYRLRNTYLENEAGTAGLSPAHSNRLAQRLRFNLSLKAAERLSANASLLGEFAMGQSKTGVAGEPRDAVRVNQAFGNWMISDDVWIKFGRMNYQIADGFTLGINDWEAVPYAFDGVLLHYEVEFARIQVFAFKMRNYSPTPVAGGTAAANVPDFQHNAYGLVFELKTMPDFIKLVNLHVIKDAADRGDETPPTQVATVKGTQGMEIVRYGAEASVAYSLVDLKLWYAGVTGKNKFPNNTAYTYHGAYDVNTSLVQGEIGVNFNESHPMRVYVQYHVDSGDRDATDKENGTYDSYFHIKHASAGHMDLFDYGNLTYLQAGITYRVRESTLLGLTYWMLERTETGPNSARPLPGLFGGNLAPAAGTTDIDYDGSKLGDEIDLWADHTFSNGLASVARVGYFRPGEVFDVVNGRNRTEGIVQLMVEGRIDF